MPAEKLKAVKPDIFDYLDYKEYLNDLVGFIKDTSGESMRSLSRQAGLSNDYLQKVAKGHLALSLQALNQLAPVLGISASDKQYLERLRDMAEAPTVELRKKAFQKISRLGAFKNRKKNELNAHEYLKSWIYPTIRELALVEGFEATPEWIQPRLKQKVGKSEIRQALRFLVDNGYLVKSENGDVGMPEDPKRIVCEGGVYKVALADYHTSLLDLAIQSMFDDPREMRKHKSHIMAIPHEKIEEVRGILDKAIEDIADLTKNDEVSNDQVVQVNVLAFPLLKTNKDKDV